MQHPLMRPDKPGDWPIIVPIVCTVIVAAIAGVTASQERFNNYSLALGIAAAALIVLPFAIDLIGAIAGKETPGLWLWFFPLPVAIGVLYFMFHPAEVDIAPFILVFTAGEIVSRSRGAIGAALLTGAIGILTVISAQAFGPWADGAFIWVAGISFGWLGGFLVRELDTKTHELEAAQAGLAEKAASEERSRIAREVHDVIAHSLSVTMLHVTAARMALEKGDRVEEAKDALREAEQQGRQSLAEVRRTVGLLGQSDGKAPPLPTAIDLPALVEGFREAGLDATLRMDGDVGTLAPATSLNVYRIVQESLTNVAKHAPHSTATVDLDVTEDDIRLNVHNGPLNGTAVRSGDGLGLRGMAERAVAIGGELTTDASNGWTVSLVAPRSSE
jgi:signal transduction histidine kinase